MKLTNLKIVLRDEIIFPGTIVIGDKKIIDITHGIEKDGKDMKGAIATPAFIDIHTHGGYNFDLMENNLEKMNNYLQSLASEGIQGVVQCTITAPWDKTIETLNWYRDNRDNFKKNGVIHFGIHYEGIFMSAEKKGAHNDKLFLKLDPKKIDESQKASGNNIRIMTYAPEHDDKSLFLSSILANDIIPSIGHSNANYEQTMNAIDNGAKSSTHLFNAMRGINHRDSSVSQAVLMSDEINCEIITDGIHVVPSMVKFAYKIKGPDKLTCVTDSLFVKGMKNGTYSSGGYEIVKKGLEIKTKNGTIAGGASTMLDCYNNIIEFTGCSLIDAAKMTSTNQATLIGEINKLGSIEIGKFANIAIIKEKELLMTILKGEIKYENNKVQK